MGGASTQITFAPNSTETEKHKQSLYKVAIGSLSGNDDTLYDIYSRTYDGLGVHMARRQYLSSLAQTSEHGKIEDPCLPSGLELEGGKEGGHRPLGDSGIPDGVTIVGSGDFDLCLQRIRPLLKSMQDSKKPEFDFEVNHFVGVSEYWDTVGDHGFQMGGSFDYNELSARVKEFCDRDWKDIESQREDEFPHVNDRDLETLCFKATFLLDVIDTGLGFPIDTSDMNSTRHLAEFMKPLSAAEEIQGVEFSWTLGRALLYSSAELTKSQKHVGIQLNSASSAWNFGTTTYQRPMFVAPKNDNDDSWDDWDDAFDKHSHRLWGSLLFLLILAVACYLLLGKARRGYIFESLRSRVLRKKDGYLNLGRRAGHVEEDAADFELGRIDEEVDDAYELEDDDIEESQQR
jgi:Golgi nucleoside diphosphatase